MTEFQKYITQKDTTCDECKIELPTGSFCYVSEDNILCEDCGEKLEAKNNLLSN